MILMRAVLSSVLTHLRRIKKNVKLQTACKSLLTANSDFTANIFQCFAQKKKEKCCLFAQSEGGNGNRVETSF